MDGKHGQKEQVQSELMIELKKNRRVAETRYSTEPTAQERKCCCETTTVKTETKIKEVRNIGSDRPFMKTTTAEDLLKTGFMPNLIQYRQLRKAVVIAYLSKPALHLCFR